MKKVLFGLLIVFISFLMNIVLADPPGRGVNNPLYEYGYDDLLGDEGSRVTKAEAEAAMAAAQSQSNEECGEDSIKLNTDVPFVGKCIKKDSSGKAFPQLMAGISKLVINIIMIVSFLLLVAGGLFMSLYGFNQGAYSKGKGLILKVIVGIILLGTSGIILHLINPNFFK